ncbi:hypothetical protein V1478_009094, partial [Vespula squamosa]
MNDDILVLAHITQLRLFFLSFSFFTTITNVEAQLSDKQEYAWWFVRHDDTKKIRSRLTCYGRCGDMVVREDGWRTGKRTQEGEGDELMTTTTTTTTRFNSSPTDSTRFDSTFLRYDSVQFVVIRLRSVARLEKSRTKSKRGKARWTPWGVSAPMDGTIYQPCHT